MEIEETGEHYMPCSKCSQKCYKKHREKEFFDESASFFKIMLGDFAEKLRIPPAFVSQIINDHDEHMVLQGPDGQNFNVQLCRSIQKLELQHGWINFVNHYGLEVGDLLVFKYISESCFKVKIFDKTSCQQNQRIQRKSSFQGNSSSHKHMRMESAAPFISDVKSLNVNQPYMEDNQEEDNGDKEEGMAIDEAHEEDDKEGGSINHEVVESKANDEADNEGKADPNEEKVSSHHRIERVDSRLFYFCEYGSCCMGVRRRFWDLKSLNAHRASNHKLPLIEPRKSGRKPIGQQKHPPPSPEKIRKYNEKRKTDVDCQLKLRYCIQRWRVTKRKCRSHGVQNYKELPNKAKEEVQAEMQSYKNNEEKRRKQIMALIERKKLDQKVNGQEGTNGF